MSQLMQNIAQMSEEASLSIRDVAEEVQTLSNLSDNLVGSIDKFKL